MGGNGGPGAGQGRSGGPWGPHSKVIEVVGPVLQLLEAPTGGRGVGGQAGKSRSPSGSLQSPSGLRGVSPTPEKFWGAGQRDPTPGLLTCCFQGGQ